LVTILQSLASLVLVAVDLSDLSISSASGKSLSEILKSLSTSCLKVNKTIRYFLWSPITTALARNFIYDLISSSRSTGATFSPPPVIISSLILPVMARFPLLSNLPTSPECNHPYSSIVSLVAFSFLK